MNQGTIIQDYKDRMTTNSAWKADSFLSVFASVVFLVWAIIKGIAIEFCVAIWPVLLMNQFIIIYGASQRPSTMKNRWVIWGVCLLNICGAMAQAAVGFQNDALFYALSVLAMIAMGILIRKVSYEALAGWAFVFTIAAMGACCFLTQWVNGAKAWITIGSLSIQVTEVVKLFYVLFVGCMFMTNFKPRVKALTSGILLCLGAAVMVYVNEFGTLLVMGSCYLLIVPFMLSDKKPLYKWITLLALVAVAVVAVMFYNAGAEKMDKWKCPECATINQRATECQNGDCEHKAALLAYSFRCPTCHYLTWDEDAPESYTQNCEMCQENHFALGSALGKLSQKLYARGSVVFEADYQKVSGNAFHVQQNLQAIRSGGLFGNQDAIVYVPASDTDSVMASSMNRLGLAYALIVLFALGFIFLGIYRATSPLRITATCAFVFQALYTFGGTLNFLPMTGIGMPLVSRGGTNLIISFLLIYFMISAVRNREA